MFFTARFTTLHESHENTVYAAFCCRSSEQRVKSDEQKTRNGSFRTSMQVKVIACSSSEEYELQIHVCDWLSAANSALFTGTEHFQRQKARFDLQAPNPFVMTASTLSVLPNQ